MKSPKGSETSHMVSDTYRDKGGDPKPQDRIRDKGMGANGGAKGGVFRTPKSEK